MGQAAVAQPDQRAQKPALDLVHLSRQTLGDANLEREILSLFASQARLYVDRMHNATTADARRMAAHTILGSARGVGAWRVAAVAEACHSPEHSDEAIAELAEAVAFARSFINDLLNEYTEPLAVVR